WEVRRADPRRRSGDVVARPPQLDVRPQERPVRAGLVLERHPDAARVDETLPAGRAIELDVGVAADDGARVDTLKHRRDLVVRREPRNELLVAARSRVAEERRPESVDVEQDLLRKAA